MMKIKCYRCPEIATTKCQKCNTPSCVTHVNSIGLLDDRMGGFQLLCSGCQAHRVTDFKLDFVIGGVFLALLLSLFVVGCTVLKNAQEESIQNDKKEKEFIQKHLEDPEKYPLPKR